MNISNLIEDYVKNNQSIKDIAIRNSVSKHKIRKILIDNNIPIRTKNNIGTLELSGKKFGKLTIIHRAVDNELVKKRAGTYWICKCECGNLATLRGSSIVNGSTRSCGCLWKTSKYEQIPGEYLTRLKDNASRRKLSFNVTPKYLWNLFLKQNSKCAMSNVNIFFDKKGVQTASLDRINSSIGYEEGNLQWVHKDINQMKMDMPEDIFLKWIFLIANAKR